MKALRHGIRRRTWLSPLLRPVGRRLGYDLSAQDMLKAVKAQIKSGRGQSLGADVNIIPSAQNRA
jgi:hypothetical protein